MTTTLARPDHKSRNAAPGVPTLPAYRVGSQLWVWCAHEARWHYHGGGPGDRAAHCACPCSPLWRTGYVLDEVGPLTPAVRRRHRVSRRHRCAGDCGLAA